MALNPLLTVKKNHIGPAANEILRYKIRQTNRQKNILLLINIIIVIEYESPESRRSGELRIRGQQILCPSNGNFYSVSIQLAKKPLEASRSTCLNGWWEF